MNSYYKSVNLEGKETSIVVGLKRAPYKTIISKSFWEIFTIIRITSDVNSSAFPTINKEVNIAVGRGSLVTSQSELNVTIIDIKIGVSDDKTGSSASLALKKWLIHLEKIV